MKASVGCSLRHTLKFTTKFILAQSSSPRFILAQGVQDLSWQGVQDLSWQGVQDLSWQGVQDLSWQGVQDLSWQSRSPKFILALKDSNNGR